MRVLRGRLLPNLLGSVAVLLGLGVLAYGLPAVDRALPAERPVDSARPYPVGAGVTVVPPPGALVDVTGTRPGVERGSVLFVLGAVRYAIAVAPFEGDLDDAAARLRNRITETRGYQVAGTEFGVATATGLPGLQGGYTGPGRGGRYAVFLVGGLSVEVTVSGTDAELRQVLLAVETSTRSITYRGGG
jgi:hypothetical protein